MTTTQMSEGEVRRHIAVVNTTVEAATEIEKDLLDDGPGSVHQEINAVCGALHATGNGDDFNSAVDPFRASLSKALDGVAEDCHTLAERGHTTTQALDSWATGLRANEDDAIAALRTLGKESEN